MTLLLENQVSEERKMLPLSILEEDPLNQEAFSLTDLEELATSIKNNGFFGDIAAYQLPNGMYRIESGHRRYHAARMAGLKRVPVLIREAPKSMIERRVRLTMWNMHGRKYTPMDIGRLVQFTYDTIEMKKKSGEVQGSIVEMTAEELGISTTNVSRYKSLLALIPELQRLVESGEYSWAILAKASQLDPAKQEMLYKRIINQGKIHTITGKWIDAEIEEFKHIKLNSAASSYGQKYRQMMMEQAKEEIPAKEKKMRVKATAETSSEGQLTHTVRKRRKDSVKALRNAYQYIRIAVDDDVLLKDSDKEEAERLIMEMQRMLRNAMLDI